MDLDNIDAMNGIIEKLKTGIEKNKREKEYLSLLIRCYKWRIESLKKYIDKLKREGVVIGD